MERFAPPLTLTHFKVFFRAKWSMFLQVYIAIPLIFMYGFKFAFPQFDSNFFITGFIANTAFMGAYFTAAFEGYNRIFFTRQYEAYWAATMSLRRMMAEDVAWYALRGTIAALICGVVGYATMGADKLVLLPAMVPVMLLLAIHAAAFGLLCASLSKSFDHLVHFETLMSLMFVFSGVFVMVSAMPGPLQILAMAFPLYHGVELIRGLGGVQPLEPLAAVVHVAVLAVSTVVLFWLAHWRLKVRIFA